MAHENLSSSPYSGKVGGGKGCSQSRRVCYSSETWSIGSFVFPELDTADVDGLNDGPVFTD